MEIRKIKPEEKLLSDMIDAIVFLGEMDAGYKEKLKEPQKHGDGYEAIWGGFDDTGKMVSSICSYDFSVRFDGHTVGMAGIGGVGTLPEARTGGSVRRMLERILTAAREEGKVFSFLYPFSYEFYRKFGYELCWQPDRVTAPVKNFREYKFPDGMSAYAPGDDLSPYAEVYEKFIRNKNLAMVRDDKLTKKRVDHDPYLSYKYGYLHRDKSGAPDAYILYEAERVNGGVKMQIRELVWTAPEALHAIFGFIGGLSAQFKTIEWDTPRCVNAASMLADAYDVTVSRPASGMNRIVNVKRAFELMKATTAGGSVTVGVEDRFLPVNGGVYRLEWENGKMISVSQNGTSDGMPDLEVDVETLVQLVTGFTDLDEARHKRGVAVYGNETSLRELFPRKDMCIYNHF